MVIVDIRSFQRMIKHNNCPSGQLIVQAGERFEDTIYVSHALQSGNCARGLKTDLPYNSIGAEGAKAISLALKSGKCPIPSFSTELKPYIQLPYFTSKKSSRFLDKESREQVLVEHISSI